LEKKAIKIPKTKLNWYKTPREPLFCGGEISDMYIGAAMEETPTAKPPMNLKKEKVKGSIAKADPRAEMRKNKPIQDKVIFRPNLLVG